MVGGFLVRHQLLKQLRVRVQRIRDYGVPALGSGNTVEEKAEGMHEWKEQVCCRISSRHYTHELIAAVMACTGLGPVTFCHQGLSSSHIPLRISRQLQRFLGKGVCIPP